MKVSLMVEFTVQTQAITDNLEFSTRNILQDCNFFKNKFGGLGFRRIFVLTNKQYPI